MKKITKDNKAITLIALVITIIVLLILAGIAVAGLSGNGLFDRTKIAKEKNYKNWIFAFMYSNNTSQKMALRNKTEVIREYALYGKETSYDLS